MDQDKKKESSEENINDKKDLETRQTATESLVFLGFAVLTYILYTSIIISAQDILASTSIPTTSLIMCFNTPYFILTLILPYYIDKLGLMRKAFLAAVFYGFGLLMIALIPTPAYRLIGVVIASIGNGISEMGFLSGTSLHQDLTVHSFTCGTGIGAMIGTTYSTVVSSILCVKPSTILLSLLVILPAFPILAWLIIRSNPSTEMTKTPQGNHAQFTRLENESSEIDLSPLTWKEKLLLARDNLFLALPLYIGLFCDYLTTQAIITTLVFENTPFDPRNHFAYYQLVFWCAEIIGRSYGLVILFFKPTCTVVTNKTWIFSAIIIGNMVVLLCASWFRFLPSFGVAALLVMITGTAEGALYLNTFAVAGSNKNRPRNKEFSRAFLTAALQGGIVAAALVGIVVEPKLREHCRELLKTETLCFTRLSHGQWNSTTSCLVR